MARVTYGESITEYAGSIGGVTYQKNASGNIARLRPKPTVNPTSLQAGYQTNMAKLVAYWPTLSPEDKTSWHNLATTHKHTTPWGIEKKLSGYQWFLSINLTHLLFYDTVIEYPFSFYLPPPPDQFTIEATVDHIKVIWDPIYNAPYDLIAYCSLPLRQSSLKLRRSQFLIKIYDAAPSLGEWELTDEIKTLFNVTWADFFASANCSIIIRLAHSQLTRGWRSFFTSAIVKIN